MVDKGWTLQELSRADVEISFRASGILRRTKRLSLGCSERLQGYPMINRCRRGGRSLRHLRVPDNETITLAPLYHQARHNL